MKRSTDAAIRAIENAQKNPHNPFVLSDLFKTADDVHNHHSHDVINRWISVLNRVARCCADSKSTRESAFDIFKAVFNKPGQSVNVRFYALGAMYLLGTENALPIMVEASKDPALLKEIPHIHEWIDSVFDKLLTRGWKGDDRKVLDALGAALGTCSDEMRIYFSDKLLLMGTREAHKVLVEKSPEYSNECLVNFLIMAYDLKYHDDAGNDLSPEYSEALLMLFDRVKRDEEFHIAPEALRPLVEKAVKKRCGPIGEKDILSKTAYIMERLSPQKAPPEPPRPRTRRPEFQARKPPVPKLALVDGGKIPGLPR